MQGLHPGDATRTLPRFDDARAWYGPEMAARDDWTCTRSPPELAELDAATDAATDAAIARGADGPALPERYTRDVQGRTASGRPDGIRVPGVPLVAPLEPA